MTFLESSSAAIAPARLVRLGPSRDAEIQELENLVWASDFLDDTAELTLKTLDPSRTIGIEGVGAGGHDILLAIASAWPFSTPVLGGRASVGGLTWVGVRPGYRRRGLLRALLAQHFTDCLERGDVGSMLFASDMSIYGRFGYGVATRGVRLRVPHGSKMRQVFDTSDVRVRFETANFDEHNDLVEAIDHEAGYGPTARPGWVGLTTEAGRRLRFKDEHYVQPGMEPWRIVIAERAGKPMAYAVMRRDGKCHDGVADSTAEVREFVAIDGPCAYALWNELFNLDLVTTTATPPIALDDPLFAWLENWRVTYPRMIDQEHLRILDLPRALSTRHYAAPIDLTLAVTDTLLPQNAGLWRLRGGPGSSQIDTLEGETSGIVPDVSLDIRELGSLYLGGIGGMGLMDAGLITQGRAGAVQELSRAFRGDRSPNTPRDF
jgi:predicted acetyltransferase